MREAIIGKRRALCWLFYFEGDADDNLYAWSGMHPITWDGETFLGAGHAYDMSTVKKSEGIQHTTQEFKLSGLDPSVLGGLSLSVRGKLAKVWLAALNADGQVVRDPILVSELVQDTLSFTRSADDIVSLGLNCFEALPFVGRATGGKYSHERQIELYSTDVGFEDIADIGLEGQAVDWREE